MGKRLRPYSQSACYLISITVGDEESFVFVRNRFRSQYPNLYEPNLYDLGVPDAVNRRKRLRRLQLRLALQYNTLPSHIMAKVPAIDASSPPGLYEDVFRARSDDRFVAVKRRWYTKVGLQQKRVSATLTQTSKLLF